MENCPGVPCAVTPAFTCGTSTVTDVDGNTYNTKLIGTQCWTTTNLMVMKYNNNDPIPDETNSTNNPWATSGARTENKEPGAPPSTSVSGYVGTFGYLYNWYAVNDSRKLCPSGWHVPTDSDWNKLVISIDSAADTTGTVPYSTTAGTVLKSDVTNSSVGSGLGWNPASPPSPELIQVVFPLSQVVFVLALVVSAVLETKLSSGVLLGTTPTTPSAANWNSAMALCAGATCLSHLVSPFVASGIDFKKVDKSAHGNLVNGFLWAFLF